MSLGLNLSLGLIVTHSLQRATMGNCKIFAAIARIKDLDPGCLSFNSWPDKSVPVRLQDMKCAPSKKGKTKKKQGKKKPWETCVEVIKEESLEENKGRERKTDRIEATRNRTPVDCKPSNAQISISSTANRRRRLLVRIMAAQNRSNLAPKRSVAKQKQSADGETTFMGIKDDRLGDYL